MNKSIQHLVRNLVKSGDARRPSDAIQLILSGKVMIDGIKATTDSEVDLKQSSIVSIDDIETEISGSRVLTCTNIKKQGQNEVATFKAHGAQLVLTGVTGLAKIGNKVAIDIRSVK